MLSALLLLPPLTLLALMPLARRRQFLARPDDLNPVVLPLVQGMRAGVLAAEAGEYPVIHLEPEQRLCQDLAVLGRDRLLLDVIRLPQLRQPVPVIGAQPP